METLKLQPIPLPKLQDTMRSTRPRKSAALLLGPQYVSGGWGATWLSGLILLAFPIASDVVEPSIQGPASLQEQLAGQVFSALAEAVGHPHSLYTAGRRKLQVSLFGLGNWSVAGGLTVAFQSLEAARVGGANTHPSKWALGLERVHRL